MTAEPRLKLGTSWVQTYARCLEAAPEAFADDREDRLYGNFPSYSRFPDT